MNQLYGKIALVLGAKGGLGTFVTQAFLDAGATVYGSSRSIEQKDFSHPAFHAAPAELNSADSARTLVDSIVKSAGRIDALVHLVGGFDMGPTIDATPEATFEKMFDVNFRSALHIFSAVIPHMRSQRSGSILAVGSKAALDPSANTGPYNISKAALLSLVRTIAEENKPHGISANIVHPGTMDTAANRKAMPNADFSKWVHPSQVAAMLVHLASDAATQVTGVSIPIYGAS